MLSMTARFHGIQARSLGPLYVRCPDCSAPVDTGFHVRASKVVIPACITVNCPICTKVFQARAEDAFN